MTTKHLSNLEQEVMNIVWELKSCSVRNVLVVLSQNRQLAYTTVATILQRLYDKGLVTRLGQGISFIYSPMLSKEIYSKGLLQSFFDKFFSAFGDTAIASFAESIESLPKQKRESLLRLIEDNNETK